MRSRESVHFTVNGEPVEIGGAEAFAPLSDTLRYRLRKTGTKVVCAEGDCGACTVMVARVQDSPRGPLRFRSLNACILPTFLADGCHIVTVEGLGRGGELHEVQAAMVRKFGGQCGFCTPGFVMSIANLYEHKAEPTAQNVKNYLTGNLCRCTGYQPIIEAAQDVDAAKCVPVRELFPLKAETARLRKIVKTSLLIPAPERLLCAPVSLREAAAFKRKHPGARIFSGATDIGVQINKGKDAGAKQLSLHLVEELYALGVKAGEARIGARVTLDRLQPFMERHVPELGRFLHIFASPQIKNSATLVGNLANASPIADTTPFLMTVEAEAELVSARGRRLVPVSKLFKGYKQLALRPDELIAGLRIPLQAVRKARLGLYKVSQRRDLDISCVNASFLLRTKGRVIESARVAYGGVGPVPLRLRELEEWLEGREPGEELIEQGKRKISGLIEPLSDVRGSAGFRRLLSGNLFERYVREHLLP